MDLAIDPSTTLADLVTSHPDLAGELERRSLDYCCGGQRTLAEACRAHGLDPEATALELAGASTATGPSPWASLDAAALVDHIEAEHHAYLHRELPRLRALAAKVHGVHGAAHPELTAVVSTFGQLHAELEPHLAKEERVLFPLIRQLAADRPEEPRMGLTGPISQMLREHDHAGELLERLRRSTDGYRVPPDGCASYGALYRGLEALEADTHLHVHIENNRLFPMVAGLESGGGAAASRSAR
ncbi:MAG TPA: iron-sulfur cluster repair di-iron protein [Acidimicrobiales bacterium]|nr:iron-sulfur cluster repair di-iron protein [Acidimicrobiales bacterium]